MQGVVCADKIQAILIRMSFENRASHEKLSPLLENAHRKSREVLAKYSINMADFASVYTPAGVAADMAHVAELKRRFAKSDTPELLVAKQMSEISEAFVVRAVNEYGMFGDSASMYATTDFDDFVNGTDAIGEWYTPEDGSRLLALGVDATFSTQGIEKKLVQIRHEIDSGKLGSLRYFRDKRGDFMGTRNNVPRTVIGVSAPVVERLSRLWIEGDEVGLARHPVQFLFLHEIHTQLEAMCRYARTHNKPDVVVAYAQALATIRRLLSEKQKLSRGDIGDDKIAQGIGTISRQVFG
jgi:hypothetical protein